MPLFACIKIGWLLWIGTYDGLNLYNGKDTYVYRFRIK